MSCERHNMASKRSYETYTDVAAAYKHAIEHLESLVHEPEEWIEEPGSIASNEHRSKRRMKKRESSDGADAMAPSSYGMHDLLQADLAGFTAVYDQQGTSRDTRNERSMRIWVCIVVLRGRKINRTGSQYITNDRRTPRNTPTIQRKNEQDCG